MRLGLMVRNRLACAQMYLPLSWAIPSERNFAEIVLMVGSYSHIQIYARFGDCLHSLVHTYNRQTLAKHIVRIKPNPAYAPVLT